MRLALPIVGPVVRWTFGRHWALSTFTALAGVWLAVVPRWADRVFTDPLDDPLPLAPRGVVDRVVKVYTADRYQLQLRFPYGERTDSASRDSLRELVGGFERAPHYVEHVRGVGVPLRWSVRDAATGAPVAGGDTVTAEANGWSGVDIERGVAAVWLRRGRYRLRVAVLRDVPAFATVSTRLVLGVPSKASESSVVGLAWWSLLVTYFLRPAAAGAALLLAVQAAADAWTALAARRRGHQDGPITG